MNNARVLYDHPEDTPLRSSVNDIRLFIEHPVWVDMRTFLEDRITAQREQLERQDLSLEQLRFIQGVVASAKDLLDLPAQMIEWVTDEKNLTESQDGND